MTGLRKTFLAGLAALTLATGVAGSTAPAAAWYRGYGYGWGGPVAAGVIGGLAAGAIVGSVARPYGYGYAPYGYYGPAPVYDPCYRARRPVFDAYGNVAGYRPVRVCN